jgi:hypothetical protein
MRLSYSGRAAHRVSLSQGQEAFLEAHVHAFARLGGVPLEQIRYDNLKPAVSRVLFGRSRVESDRWVAFRSHYGFDAFYCQPGHEGSHEKGGVEGEGGRFRRNHCVPMPAVGSVDELNALLEAWDDADDRRRIGNRASSVGNDWAFERQLLRPLPAESFDTALTLTPRVDRYAQVMVRCCQYSVPTRFIGHRVRVKLSAPAVTVYDKKAVVARHQRAAGKGVKVLDLDHYLEILLRKPGALPGATALAQARAAATFTPAHDAFWAAARRALGDGPGTRALVEVLLLHRHLGHSDVLAGIKAALAVGSVSPDVVAVEARKAAQQRGEPQQVPVIPRPRQVISLTERRQAGYRVRYTLASKLVNELAEAADDKQLSRTIARYGRVDLLCLDELGYMELDRRGAELLFQVLTEREERSAIAIASNEPFSGWTKTFTDPRLCAAIVDRLTFAGQIIETGTTSYRLAQSRKKRSAASTRPG